MPKITVIVSAWNERGWLDEAILSAKNQTFDDYEIILSSDGNTDLVKYADKYEIRFTCAEKNCHSSALNNAVKEARGEWIKECHDDDLLTPNCLTDLWNNKDGADLLYANAINFVESNKEEFKIYKPPTEIALLNFLPIIKNPVPSSTIFYKRDVFLKVGGFDPDLKHAEEYLFYLNLLTHGYKFKYVDSNVAWYRYNSTQDSYILAKCREEVREYIQNKFNSYISVESIVNNIKW
jgi:teichuronic acid biosynthesis glycosyltransferase TuaG